MMVLATELRESVYQAAMQGKLSKQNIDSEKSPMDYIMTEKNDLLKKHLIKKDKRLFIDDEIEEFPYDIPDNWKWTYLGNILQKLTDGTHRTPKYSDVGVKFISVKDMSSGKICFDNTKYITAEEHKELYKRCDPKRGDMLLSKIGTTGIPAFVDTDEEFSLFVSVALLRFNHDYILPQFLYYLIYSPLVQWQAIENTRGVGNQNWVLDKIARTLIVLPPIEEQQRIVDRVNELMRQIDEYAKIEQQIISLKASFPGDLRSAILQAAMQGKLTEQLDTDSSVDELIVNKNESEPIKRRGKKSTQMDIEIFDIPSSWRWTKLSECGTTNIGLTYSPEDVTTAKDGTVVLRSSNIQNGKMDYTDIVKVNIQVPENKKCHIGDILICARNGSKRLVGKTAIIDREGDAFGAFMAIYRSACNSYIYYVLNSPHFRKSVLGGAETTTINQVTQDMVENYMFPLPPKEEQGRIVERLETLLPLCESVIEE